VLVPTSRSPRPRTPSSLAADPQWLNILGPSLATDPSQITRSRPQLPSPFPVECHALAAASGCQEAWRYGDDRRRGAFWRQGWPLPDTLHILLPPRLISSLRFCAYPAPSISSCRRRWPTTNFPQVVCVINALLTPLPMLALSKQLVFSNAASPGSS
jgi:hypothetical protein